MYTGVDLRISRLEENYVELCRMRSECDVLTAQEAARQLGREAARAEVCPVELARLHARVAAESDWADRGAAANEVLVDVMQGWTEARSNPRDIDKCLRFERFRELCRSTPIAMFITTTTGDVLYGNPRLTELVGCQEEDLLGRSWEALVAEEDRRGFTCAVDAAYSERRSFAAEARLQTVSGSVRWVSVRSESVITPDGDEQLRIGIVEDITARREALAALKQSESQFRDLAESVPAAILIYRGKTPLYVNPTMAQITGFSREELMKMAIWDVVHPEMRGLAEQYAFARQAGEDAPTHYEIKLLTKSRETRWVDYLASSISYDGEPAVLGAAVDITDRKRAEEAAQQRRMELMHVSRVSTLGKMAAEVTHELSQPLSAIVNYANGCCRRLSPTDTAHRDLLAALTEIRNEAERAGTIIRSMRDFVRKRPTQQVTQSVNGLVREATELAMAACDRHQAPLRLNLAEGLPPACIDRVQIMQVVVNLVTNAIEAMHGNAEDDRDLRVSTRRTEENEVEIAVADRGHGFEGSVEQLFEPFNSTKANGLGLGLSICRSIVEAHGGRLWPTNNADRGVTFRVTLPIAEGK